MTHEYDEWAERIDARKNKLHRFAALVRLQHPFIKQDPWPQDVFKDYRGQNGKTYTLVYSRATGGLNSAYVTLRTGKIVHFTSAFDWAYAYM